MNCIIVVPCYNEAARLNVDAFRSFVAQGHPQRFLFVNDGSTDQTSQLLTGLCASDPERFALCNLPRNVGKAEAVRHGILTALQLKPDFVGFWDADLATPLQALPEFCRILERNWKLQIVIGARVRLLGRAIERRPLRHYLGRVFATVASMLLRLPVYDTQCGAKLFRASPETERLFAAPFRVNWLFDVEMLARFIDDRGICATETAIYEVPLTEWRDVAGSKVKAWDFLKAIGELAHVYWRYLRHRRSRATTLAPPHVPAGVPCRSAVLTSTQLTD